MNLREFWTKVAQGVVATVIGGILLAVVSALFPNDWPGWLRWLEGIGDILIHMTARVYSSLSSPIEIWVGALLFIGALMVFLIAAILRRFLRLQRAQEYRIEKMQMHIETTEAQRNGMIDVLKTLGDPDVRSIPPSFSPTREQRRIVAYLLTVYPRACELGELHLYTRCKTPAHTDVAIDGLLAANVLKRGGERMEQFLSFSRNGREQAMTWGSGIKPRPRRSKVVPTARA